MKSYLYNYYMEYFTRKPDNLKMPKSVSDIVVYKTKEQKLQEIDNLFKQIMIISLQKKVPKLIEIMGELEEMKDKINNPPLTKRQQREIIKQRRDKKKALKLASEIADNAYMELMREDTISSKKSKKKKKKH